MVAPVSIRAESVASKLTKFNFSISPSRTLQSGRAWLTFFSSAKTVKALNPKVKRTTNKVVNFFVLRAFMSGRSYL